MSLTCDLDLGSRSWFSRYGAGTKKLRTDVQMKGIPITPICGGRLIKSHDYEGHFLCS